MEYRQSSRTKYKIEYHFPSSLLWLGGKIVEALAGMIGNLNVEVLEPVLCKGIPEQATFSALEQLADAIDQKHKESSFR